MKASAASTASGLLLSRPRPPHAIGIGSSIPPSARNNNSQGFVHLRAPARQRVWNGLTTEEATMDVMEIDEARDELAKQIEAAKKNALQLTNTIRGLITMLEPGNLVEGPNCRVP